MSLLKLNDIGKIYVSEKNVAVGIRGVNLSFDAGEFVAITGKSGSGKSTLLNVISGMDSYEEGELYINGEPTSHYLQPDWEEYREKYISFIFQDYNIIDSFTVLENVELALMHIEDNDERRRRALELIECVGLSSHIKHKGSKLSGGQKQRTVIARALAKDSPIILADEPTGNLDSQTSKEIIELLRRVSTDKLVIVVTHDFEDFSHCATRHIRIHDGAVELDHEISDANTIEAALTPEKVKKSRYPEIKDGMTLGLSIFKAKPRLTAFLCLLMMIGTIGLFLVTSLCGNASNAFKPKYMFNNIEGRLVLTTKSGRVMNDDEVKELATKYGAESYLRYDVLLDNYESSSISIPSSSSIDGVKYLVTDFTYGEDYGGDIIGRYPENNDEVFLYLPISYSDEFGKETIEISQIDIFSLPLQVCGIKYYYDNNITPKCLFTEEGFRVATAAQYLTRCTLSISADVGNGRENIKLYRLLTSFDIPEDKVYILSSKYDTIHSENVGLDTSVYFKAVYYKYNYYGGYTDDVTMNFSRDFADGDITDIVPTYADINYGLDALVVSDEILCDIAYSVLSDSYKQASLFFKTTKEAHRVAELIDGDEYIAVPADITYTDTAAEAVFSLLESVIIAILWCLAVVFIAFFINLCSIRAVESFKGDIAIMRSMGIQVKTIKFGIYVRMALCLIPAFALLLVMSTLIYTSNFNEYFKYLYAWQYAAILLGMIILTLRTTKKQIKRLFSDSVKRTIKGVDAA